MAATQADEVAKPLCHRMRPTTRDMINLPRFPFLDQGDKRSAGVPYIEEIARGTQVSHGQFNDLAWAGRQVAGDPTEHLTGGHPRSDRVE